MVCPCNFYFHEYIKKKKKKKKELRANERGAFGSPPVTADILTYLATYFISLPNGVTTSFMLHCLVNVIGKLWVDKML